MPTNDLSDLEESLARAITAQDNLDQFTRDVTADYGNEVNYNDGGVNAVNFSQRMASKSFVCQVTMPYQIQFNHEIILDLA